MKSPAQKKRIIPARQKKYAVEQVLKSKRDVTGVAKELGVARKTVYVWIKRYKQTPRRNKSKAFRARYVSGKRHPRAVAPKARHTLIRLVTSRPEWGCRKLSLELKKSGFDLGYFGVNQLLSELSASTPELRENFKRNYSGPGRLEADIKLEIVRRVLEEKKSISQVAEEYGVARKTIYQWLKRYEDARERGLVGAPALKETYVSAEAHPRAIYPKISEKLLGLVAEKPELSVHGLAKLVPASSWTVWKILDRNNLNLYQQRLAYAEKIAASKKPILPVKVFDRLKLVWEQFIPSLAPAPPPSVTRILKVLGVSSFLSFLFFIGIFSWIRLLSGQPLSNAIGLIFASLALFMGSIFFLYSLKYYLTLAIVLSFSQQEVNGRQINRNGRKRIFLSWLLGLADGNGNGKNGKNGRQGPVGLEPNLERISLKKYPAISIQIPLYNEKNVAKRAMAASTSFNYKGEYEIIIADDSTDETPTIIRNYQKKYLSKDQRLKVIKGKGWTLTSVKVRPGVTLKHLHRTSRSGFKGGALKKALELTDPEVEFISVFDADFVPYPDTLELFLKYFKVQNNMSEDYQKSNVAAVQGYQWHVLNKSENWITRGVRAEYAGSYVIERSGREIYGALKQISGAVYMIRRDALEEVGWETSITEDFQLTLKLYEKGYKVVFTPYIQAPAECVSTIKRLIRQRMRWAEGHSNNIKKMFRRLMFNPKLTNGEKLEFFYLSPYYLQAFFFLTGTLSWLLSETIFPARLPFWTSLWGWSLVLTNMLSLPLMNAVGLFLEESEERDYLGLASFVALSYILVPFQAYASLKGFLEREEGPWFRTPKTGRITDVFTRGKFYRFISGILPGRTPVPVVAETHSYLALSSANNQFSNFKIQRHHSHWAGNLIFSLSIIFTSLLVVFSPFIPLASSSLASPPRMVTVGEAMASEPAPEKEGTKEIATPQAIRLRYNDQEDLEMIFHQEPRVRIKVGRKELEITTLSLEGLGVAHPAKSLMVGTREIRYEEIVPGVDLVYLLNRKGFEEKFIVKKPLNLTGISQKIVTKEVDVVNPFPDVFAFNSEENEEVFKFNDPWLKEVGQEEKIREINLTLEKDILGYKLEKSLTQKGRAWLSAPERQFPVEIDPSVIVSSTITDTDVEFGGQQQKLVFVNNAYYAFHNDGSRIAYKKCTDVANHCDDDTDWSSNNFMSDGGGSDNEGPDTWLDGSLIWVAWFNDSTDDINLQSIDTASSDTLGTACNGPDMGNVTIGYIVTVTRASSGDFVVAYGDNPDIYEIEDTSISSGNCNAAEGDFQDITAGSGMTSGDRHVATAAGNVVHIVWQEGGGPTSRMRHNYYDTTDTGEGWGTEVQVASIGEDSYGLTSDSSLNLWLHTADGTAATALYKCAATCTGTWVAQTAPFTGQTSVETATITYASTENDLVLSVIMDTSDQAYFKTTDAGTISYSNAYSYGFTAGDLIQIASMERISSINDAGVVLRQGTNFEFATVPERSLVLTLLAPLLPGALKKLKKKKKGKNTNEY